MGFTPKEQIEKLSFLEFTYAQASTVPQNSKQLFLKAYIRQTHQDERPSRIRTSENGLDDRARPHKQIQAILTEMQAVV